MTNIQNIYNNECFKSCLVRYLHSADHISEKIRKADQDFPKKLDFKEIKFPAKITDIQKIEKNNFISINFFGYESKDNIKAMCQEVLLHVDLLLLREEQKRYYVLFKDFSTFKFNPNLHCRRKHSCFCLQTFITVEILKSHINDCFKINSKQISKMPKKGEYVRFKKI